MSEGDRIYAFDREAEELGLAPSNAYQDELTPGRVHRALLSDSEQSGAREMRRKGALLREIADRFCISITTAHRITTEF